MRTHRVDLLLLVFVATTSAAVLACGESGRAPAPVAPAPAAPEPAAPLPSATAVAQAPAAPTQTVAKLGKPAPDFTLTDTEGTSHTLSALRGKTVVLEWFNPDCPFVKAAQSGVLKGMAKRVVRDDRVWLSINSGAPGKQGHGSERNRQAREELGFAHPILLDEAGAVGHSYGAARTPHMFVVDAKGTLAYRGGIDNAPMGAVDDDRPRMPDSKPGEQLNYVDAALADLEAGRPLRLPDTPPYGCTVKY